MSRKGEKLGKRLVHWFTYNVAFALFPLFSSLFFRFLAGKLTIKDLESSPELLFFSIMLSANALAALRELTGSIERDTKLIIFESALFLGAVCSAVLYGGFIFEAIVGANIPGFQSKIFRSSVALAMVLGILSTLVEIFIGKIKNTTDSK